jgi:hypothetical protein
MGPFSAKRREQGQQRRGECYDNDPLGSAK